MTPPPCLFAYDVTSGFMPPLYVLAVVVSIPKYKLVVYWFIVKLCKVIK